MRPVTLLLCAVLVVLCARGVASPQTSSTGAVSGRVVDSRSDAVAGAEVELRNSATGLSQRQLTNGAGQYVFSPVTPGDYGLSVRMRGFRQASVSGLKVEVMKSARVRRAKLYYLRDLKGKAARMKDIPKQ